MASDASAPNSQHGALSTSPRVLITAGPTHEPIDAVRYIANRSSGRMGLSLAHACAARGWPTTLLLGPIPLPPPVLSQGRVHRFQTAADLEGLLKANWPDHDLLIMAAAVADFTPMSARMNEKIKRSDRPITITLQPTTDLLAALAALTRPDQTVVGFALEPTEGLPAAAHRKLSSKHLDAIVANPLETMDSQIITATVLFADGQSAVAKPGTSKADFASWLLDALGPVIEKKLRARLT
jgi:phosphopantothenoylcysteine decarboxylase/phosphopantothenate--cysteine ligase